MRKAASQTNGGPVSPNHKANGKLAPGHKLGNRFKPGESGNPEGRPPGSKNVSTILREMLEKLAPTEIISNKFVKAFCAGKKQITVGDALAARLLVSALGSKADSLPAIREILDRTEGKALQSIDMDLSVANWEDMAERAGLPIKDVFAQAKLLIEQSDPDTGDA